MAELRWIKGDITKPQAKEGVHIVIPHVCNNVGAYGAGVAKAIAKKWPAAKEEYEEQINNFKAWQSESMDRILGLVIWEDVEENIKVANMIAQKGLISKRNLCPLKYLALAKSMETVCEQIREMKTDDHIICEIHCPRFGSLRAGGDWEFIEKLIQEIWVDNGIDVFVYEWIGEGM